MAAKIVIFELYREVFYPATKGFMQKLGQHFLVNKEKIRAIVDALEVREGDTIIEIGPGHGELTIAMIARLQDCKIKNYKIIAIEKDETLAKNLEQRIQNLGTKNVEIIHGDALKILPEITKPYTLNPKPYKIVGNIPYYITGYLLRIIGELEYKPSLAVLTVQKEVAERIVAQPPYNNLLAASVQFWAEPKIVGYISRNDFKPQPKVDAAIIKLGTRIRALGTRDEKSYYKLIKILFKQPRKTILNNLKNLESGIWNLEYITNALLRIGINPNERAQNLSVKDIIGLAKMFFGA